MGSSKALVYAHNFLMVFLVGVLMGWFFSNLFHVSILDFTDAYLIFKVTIANTTQRIVTIQNLVTILLSWYPSF